MLSLWFECSFIHEVGTLCSLPIQWLVWYPDLDYSRIIEYGPLAQWIEQLSSNQLVRGSSPLWSTDYQR